MNYETPAVEMQRVVLEQVIAGSSTQVGGGGAGTPGGGSTPRSMSPDEEDTNWGVTER